MISTKLIKSSIIYTISSALPLASGFVLLPFYTNFLPTEMVGILSIYITLTAVFQIIASFGIDNYIIINYVEFKDNPERLKKDIGSISFLLLMIGVILILISTVFGNSIFRTIYSQNDLNYYPYIFMSVLTAIFNSYFKTYTALLIGQQSPIKYFIVNFVNFVFTILISLTGLYLYPNTLEGPMWGRLLSGIIIFSLAFYYFTKEFGLHYNKEANKSIFKYCLPVSIFGILAWVISYSDRFVITHYINKAELAVYDTALKFTFLLEYFQTGLTQTIYPKIYSIWKDKNLNESTDEVNKYHSAFTAISILGIPIFVLFIPIFIPLLIHNHDYFISFNYLALISIGFAIKGLFNMYHAPILYFRKTKVLPKIYTIMIAVQIPMTIILVKNYGIYGAIYSSIVIKFVQLYLTYNESKKIFNYSFNKVKLIYLPLLYMVFVFTSEILISNEQRTTARIIQLLATILLVYVVYRKEIIALPIFQKKNK